MKSRRLENLGTDMGNFEAFIQAQMRPTKHNPEGLSRQAAEGIAEMYRHHFRRWE